MLEMSRKVMEIRCAEDTSATHLGGLKKNKTRVRESLFVSLENDPNALNAPYALRP